MDLANADSFEKRPRAELQMKILNLENDCADLLKLNQAQVEEFMNRSEILVSHNNGLHQEIQILQQKSGDLEKQAIFFVVINVNEIFKRRINFFVSVSSCRCLTQKKS
jgi:hypothetical protein